MTSASPCRSSHLERAPRFFKSLGVQIANGSQVSPCDLFSKGSSLGPHLAPRQFGWCPLDSQAVLTWSQGGSMFSPLILGVRSWLIGGSVGRHFISVGSYTVRFRLQRSPDEFYRCRARPVCSLVWASIRYFTTTVIDRLCTSLEL